MGVDHCGILESESMNQLTSDHKVIGILHPLKPFECFQFIIFLQPFFTLFIFIYLFIYMFPLYLSFLRKDLSFIRDCPHLVDAHSWCIAKPWGLPPHNDGSDLKNSQGTFHPSISHCL